MTPRKIYISILTIVIKEVGRIFRVWKQNFIPPVITTALYFIIFGTFIGAQIDRIDGLTYMQFIVPGLVMMALIMGSFSQTSFTISTSKFFKTIEELIVSPMPVWGMVLGFILGGIARGFSVGLVILLSSLFFTTLPLPHIFVAIVFGLLSAMLFSLGGLVAGTYAKDFDALSIIPNFVLTPLTYLGGIFYSIQLLPELWRQVSLFNPILYMINGFRYGLTGVSDINPLTCFWVLTVLNAIVFAWVVYIFKTGKGLRT
jgi:ABC-2 type transport system permease protein